MLPRTTETFSGVLPSIFAISPGLKSSESRASILSCSLGMPFTCSDANSLSILSSLSTIIGNCFSSNYAVSGLVACTPFYVTTWNLVQDFTTKFTKLELLFGGKPIRTISVSKISIWNEGNETIHASDIADADRLRLSVVDGAELLMNSGRNGSRARCCSVDKCLKTLISLEISDTCFHWTTGNPDLIPNWIPKGVLKAQRFALYTLTLVRR